MPTCLGSCLLCSRTRVAMATGTAEVIVTVGGEDDKVVLRSVESFDPLANQWKNLACLPFAVSKHGLVVSGKIDKRHNALPPPSPSVTAMLLFPPPPFPRQTPHSIWLEASFPTAPPAGRCGATTPALTPG